MKTSTDNVFSLSALVRGKVPKNVDIDVVYEQFNASLSDEIDEIVALRDAGECVIPEISFSDLCADGFSDEQAELVRKRGCIIVRGTIAEPEANHWNLELNEYLNANRYYAGLQEAIEAGDAARISHPHMLDIYWSRTQVEIRQSGRLHQVQKRLNGLWRMANCGEKGAFNPDLSYTYADRVRIRPPGDHMHGLAPHVDNCSMEAWFSSETIERTYRTLLNGNWKQYDAFDAVDRVCTDRKPHPDSCGVFRSYQGWMALTPQGSGCGTLQLVPSSRCVAWMFLNMLQSSLHNDDQVSPLPIEAYILHAQKHALLIRGLCSLPQLRAGDTVWWHPEAAHAVEQTNESSLASSVAYLGIAPDCERNRHYLRSQLVSFNDGLSPPDFPTCDVEKHYENRATQAQLSELGGIQMGYQELTRAAV